jgi:Cu+-exporting ATPase
MEEAQGSRPPLQRLSDRATAWLIPAVLGLAALTLAAWLVFSDAGPGFALARAVAVVVIACPCALGLATPTAVTAGIGRGAVLGILIKGGEVLERAVGVTTVALDKTGTLTAGRLAVTAVEGAPGGPAPAEVLRLAAALERDSGHPIARAVVERAASDGIAVPAAQGAVALEGLGVQAQVDGRAFLLGSPRAAAPLPPTLQARAQALEAEGRTVIVLKEGAAALGLLALADLPRPEANEAVASLRARGLRVVMLTGDNPLAARAAAAETGVDEVMAELKPAGKAEAIAALQARGERVVFAGDGINDAVALARADVGIAMGGGTDAAREGGDIVLMRDDIRGIPAALGLANAIVRRIRWNLFWAAAWNAALVPLAAGVLYPAFHLTLPPSLAALAMAFSSVTVVTLSLSLRRFEP